MVAFIVTVQLVENKVKRMLGMLIVTILMTQYSTVEMKLRRARISRPKAPSQPEDCSAAMASRAWITADGTELVEDWMAWARLCARLPAARDDMSGDMAGIIEAASDAASWGSSAFAAAAEGRRRKKGGEWRRERTGEEIRTGNGAWVGILVAVGGSRCHSEVCVTSSTAARPLLTATGRSL